MGADRAQALFGFDAAYSTREIAEGVAKAVQRHLLHRPAESLGVVAMSADQRDQVERAVRRRLVIEHERRRAKRMVGLWETEIGNPWMQGPLNMAQITLVCALDLDRLVTGFRWRDDQPALVAWMERFEARPSLSSTLPPLRV